MDCLLPVSGLGSGVYSMMTDEHKMAWTVLHTLTCNVAGSARLCVRLMKQYRKQHWIEFSCEPWPPTRGKAGSFEEEDSWVLVSRP